MQKVERLSIRLLISACLFIAAMGSANAAIVTAEFDDVSVIASNGQTFSDSKGFDYESRAFFICVNMNSPNCYGEYLNIRGGFGVGVTRSDGGAFDLLQLDAGFSPFICETYPQSCVEDFVVVTGFNQAGDQVAQRMIHYSEEGTVVFDANWMGISRFTYDIQQGVTSIAPEGGIDNISVNVVPIPAAVWLFGSGLALIGWVRRKHSV